MQYDTCMGAVPPAETKRDEALIKDYLATNDNGEPKFSIAQLGIKYARVEGNEIYPLTSTRIHQILTKHKVSKTRIKYNSAD